jgi:hypothetical protein
LLFLWLLLFLLLLWLLVMIMRVGGRQSRGDKRQRDRYCGGRIGQGREKERRLIVLDLFLLLLPLLLLLLLWQRLGVRS